METHYLKVVDPATNEMIAFAIWLYLPHGYRLEEDPLANGEEVPEGANVKLVRDFGQMTGKLRVEHEGRKGPHWRKSF